MLQGGSEYLLGPYDNGNGLLLTRVVLWKHANHERNRTGSLRKQWVKEDSQASMRL